MRLPWPFGRAQRSPSGDGTAQGGGFGSSDGAAASSAAPAASAPERGPGDAWRRLPPLAETLGPPPLVAPSKVFEAALASSEPPAPILAPLSHGHGLDAPKGLVAGVARPVAATRGPELPRPVQRSPLRAHRDGPETLDADAPNDSPSDAATPPASLAAAVTAVTAPVAAPAAPARRLEVAATPARPAEKALTRAPDLALAKPLGLVGQPRATPARVQRAPEEAAPVQRAPVVAPPVPSTAPAPAPKSAPDREGPRLTIGQARRLGLGMPIAGGPLALGAAPFGASTATSAPAAPGATPAPTSPAAPDPAPSAIQRSPEPDSLEMPLASRPAAAPASEATELVRVQAATARAAEQLAEAPVIARRLGTPAPSRPGPASPIVSAQPLRARVQRAPLTLPATATQESGAPTSTRVQLAPSAGTGGAPVTVHRDGRASQLSKSLDARSFTHGGEIYLPASHGPLSTGKGRSLLAHELTHVTQQRKLGSSLPEEHTPHGQSLEAEAVAAERGAQLPLATPPTAPSTRGQGADAPPAADLSPAPIHAGAGGSAAHATSSTAQRAPNDGGAQGQSSSRKNHSEQELEDLASQLYARIGRQLRRELLVERERAGLAMDFR